MAKSKQALCIVFIAATLQLTACQPESAQSVASSQALHRKESPVARTTVPLVRKLSPQLLSDAITLDFAVPPQEDDPEPPIFIGLRVAAADGEAAAAKVDRLRDAGVTAQLHLYRLTEAGEQPVVLQRSEEIGRTEYRVVALGRDGHVPRIFATDADVTTMEAAGLIAPNVTYRELDMAFIRDTPPGRYRVSVRFEGNVGALEEAGSELLIAFTRKAK
ncbi:hypothetical protein NG831_19660 [Xanthomonas sacchari]|uniref:hypothetical protein n=1 Tax=Xanthomonas sacchari TaxID=56458 RepID=UPI002250CDE3|nr:hypothetical protein [Xanthomonas sacchari]MCW0411468.1 hypothetical protein [Xanthomonas sacchari]UYK66309.1 hypothetical protein NG831_19660 [Xanthomonas sacchari]